MFNWRPLYIKYYIFLGNTFKIFILYLCFCRYYYNNKINKTKALSIATFCYNFADHLFSFIHTNSACEVLLLFIESYKMVTNPACLQHYLTLLVGRYCVEKWIIFNLFEREKRLFKMTFTYIWGTDVLCVLFSTWHWCSLPVTNCSVFDLHSDKHLKLQCKLVVE